MPIVKPSSEAIAEAGRLLRSGALVALPTETVYGLGADATNPRAVAAIFEAKGRPQFNPLIVHVATREAAGLIVDMDPLAERLAGAFWPGPLTLVLPRRTDSRISDLVTAGLDTVAIRMPDHPVATAVLMAAGVPVAAPSANRSGHVSATRAEHVDEDLGARVAMIVDAGPAALGVESTVLRVIGGEVVLLRPGAVPADAIEAVIGRSLIRATEGGSAPLSPGQLESHYAPRARVRPDAIEVQAGEGLLAFGEPLATNGPVINLSRERDLYQAAAGLFAALRQLDATGVASIAVMPIPEHGLGEAINDRLRRAALGR